MPELTIEDYKKKLSLYERDPQKKGYFTLVRIVNQHIDYLQEINVKDMITKEDKTKATAEYERAKGLWEGLPKMITSLRDLKFDLKITQEDEADDGIPFIETLAQTRK